MQRNPVDEKIICKFYVTRKKRYCKMIAMNGFDFCGEHSNNIKNVPSIKRIPCPIDPKHTVFENKLKSHLKICNANQCRKLEFFAEFLNSGTDSDPSDTDIKKLVDISDIELRSILEFLTNINKKLNLVHITPENEIMYEYTIKSDKHSYQYFALINKMKSMNYLKNIFDSNSTNEALLEFGAGRGGFSHYLTEYAIENQITNVNDLLFVLIDRQGVKNRYDAKHKEGPTFSRILMDIEHLDLSKCSLINNKRCSIVSKHLCGCATDLTLRCIENWLKKQVKNDHKDLKELLNGIVIALCCHHKCTWKSYVNKDWLKQLGINKQIFQIITLLSSWATCGEVKRFKELFQQDAVLSSEEYGRMCKRIIDQGRVEYLKNIGFQCVTIESYISTSVTPENTALFATL